MAEYTLTPTPPLADYKCAFAGTTLATVADLAIVSLALPLGQEDAARAKIKSAFGVELPEPGHSVLGKGGVRLVRMNPDQALVLFTHSTPDAETVVQAQIKGAAYSTDQTDAWVALALSGSGSIPALERICPLDLHPDVFKVDMAARTVMEHLGVLLIRISAENWLLLSASSSANSFLHAVEVSLVNTTPDPD